MKACGIVGLLLSVLLGIRAQDATTEAPVIAPNDVTTEAPTTESTNDVSNGQTIFKIFALVHQLNQEVVIKQIALATCQREMADLEETADSNNPEPAAVSLPLEMSEPVPDQIPATPLEVGVPVQMPSEMFINQEQSNDESIVQDGQQNDIPVQLPEQGIDMNKSPVAGQPIQLPSVPVEVVTAEGTIQNQITKRFGGMPRMFGFLINSLLRRFMFYDQAVTQCETAVSQLQNPETATVNPEVATTQAVPQVTVSEAPSSSTAAP